jgi:hypothetical protein
LETFTHSISQALLSANENGEHDTQNISKYTHGIAFFGTPLQQLEEVDWARIETEANSQGNFEGKLPEEALQIEKQFPDFLKQRALRPDGKIRVACFFAQEANVG